MFEIINKRPISAECSDLKSVPGTKSMIPKKLLMENIKIEMSFNRLDALWFILSRCWYYNAEKRPQVWEVKDRVQDLLNFPRVDQKEKSYQNYYYTDSRISEESKVQDSLRSPPDLYTIASNSDNSRI